MSLLSSNPCMVVLGGVAVSHERGTPVVLDELASGRESHLTGCFRGAIGAIGALMNIVHQPRTLVVLGLNAGMGTAAEADELAEIPTRPWR